MSAIGVAGGIGRAVSSCPRVLKLGFALALVASLLGCSSARYGVLEGKVPGVSVPTSLGEGAEQAKPVGRSEAPPREQAPARETASPAAAPADALPDPEPLSRTKQFRYEVSYDKGRISVRSVTALHYRSPVVTARRMGRYAIELWIGKELIDRVRFDFPLLAAEAVDRAEGVPSLSAGAVVKQHVLVPDSERATSAVLVDRATGERIHLRWPPEAAAQ